MRTLLILGLILTAQLANGQNDMLEQYQWENRLILLFGSISESAVEKQITELEKDTEGITDRDLLIFHIDRDEVRFIEKSDNPAPSADKLRNRYNIGEQEFRYILIGKDGGVKLNKKEFVPNKDLFSVIDAMPMRQREMRNRK
ncbi:MAG: DUF4174 domain-containing protein [Bacteroidales bacterium]|nr:DUF4174 domain-containing protein [Bacteroidales bacterium]MBS3774604.1 DUF4174 domain-containing protein [Bacteroidales bacterium]